MTNLNDTAQVACIEKPAVDNTQNALVPTNYADRQYPGDSIPPRRYCPRRRLKTTETGFAGGGEVVPRISFSKEKIPAFTLSSEIIAF